MIPTEQELIEFVIQSNRIEMEPETPGHPLYDDHLSLALDIASRPLEWLNPSHIHSVLMKSQPRKFPGELRQVGVQVNRSEKMHAVDVRREIAALLIEAREFIFYRSKLSTDELEELCWSMHYRFEWIHPFWDGNGRAGRLWMNAIRLAVGLPWVTVNYTDRFSYYRSIEEWESTKEWHL